MRRLMVLGMVLVSLALTAGCTGVDVRCDTKLQPINRPAVSSMPAGDDSKGLARPMERP